MLWGDHGTSALRGWKEVTCPVYSITLLEEEEEKECSHLEE
jgi:hypothetical protein